MDEAMKPENCVGKLPSDVNHKCWMCSGTRKIMKPTSKEINDTCNQLELISRILRVHWSDSVVAEGQWVRGLQDRLQAIIGEICETTEED